MVDWVEDNNYKYILETKEHLKDKKGNDERKVWDSRYYKVNQQKMKSYKSWLT